MIVTRAEVEELFDLVEDAPATDRAVLAEELVRSADALGEEDLRFRARLLLVESLYFTRERHRMFAPFAWVVARFDAAPDWLTWHDRHRVLWTNKWMVSQLLQHPQVPLPQLRSVLTEMDDRYRRAGEGLAPVLGCAYDLDAHVHGAAGATDAFEAWRRAPRTDLSDCEGCEPTHRITHLAAVGRHEDAVDELEHVLRGEITCAEQPERAIGEALASLVAVGRLEAATDLHRRGYLASRGKPANTASVAQHLHVLARTGALGRGLDVLAEQLHRMDQPSTPLAGMHLAAAAARLLRAVVAAGDGDHPVRARGAQPERAADLLARMEAHALAIAALFDERNGTTAVGDRVRWLLTAPDLPALPLGPVGAAPGSVADGALELPHVPADPRLHPDADLDRLDVPALADLVALARRCAHAPTWDRLAAHWEVRRDAVLAALPPDDADLGPDDATLVRAVADLEAFASWRAADADPRHTAVAARLLRRLGDPAEAALAELLDDVRAGRPDAAAAALDAVDRTGSPHQRARARARLAIGSPDDRAAVLRSEALDLLVPAGDPPPAGRGLLAMLLLEQPGEGVDQALHERVLALLPAGEEPDARVRAHLLRAGTLAANGEPAAAPALLDEAVAAARDAGAPRLVLQVETARCSLLAATGDVAAAEERALVVATAALAEGATDVAVWCRTVAARLMADHGRQVEAVELVEAMLGVEHTEPAVGPAQAERVAKRAELLDLGAALYVALDEPERAGTLAREAVTLAEGPDGSPALAGPALLRLAAVVADGRDALEATRLHARALEAALTAGDHALALVVRRERVASRYDADGSDAALADLDDAVRANHEAQARALVDPEVAGALAHWDFEVEEVTLTVMRARVLARAGEPQRALDVLVDVPSRWERLGADGEALAAEVLRGRLLLDLGREEEGLDLLERTAGRARGAGLDGLAAGAAGEAARWLDDAGRPDEAQRLWDRHTAAGL